MEKVKIQTYILVWKFEEKRLHVRSAGRYENHVKGNLKRRSCKAVDWNRILKENGVKLWIGIKWLYGKRL